MVLLPPASIHSVLIMPPSALLNGHDSVHVIEGVNTLFVTLIVNVMVKADGLPIVTFKFRGSRLRLSSIFNTSGK